MILNMDCLEYMKNLNDNFFDLAIVDPPYGINAPNLKMGSNPNRKQMKGGISTAEKLKKGRLNKGSGKLKNRLLNSSSFDWDNEKPNDEYFKQLFRVSKNQIIFGYNYYNLPPTRGVICWDKMQPWDNFSQFELAWTSFDVPAAIIRLSNTGGNNKEIKIHPTQKPVYLYKWLLTKFAKPGDLILDTHGGSMSSVIACIDLDFKIHVTEKNKEYYDNAIKRIAEYKKQIKLF